MKTTAMLAALAMSAAGAAHAQDEALPAATAMDLHATDVGNDFASVWFNEDQQVILKTMGHQMAVAMSCEGIKVDEAAFDSRLAELVSGHQPSEGTDPEHYRSAATLILGIHFGAQLAIAGQDFEGFCANAEVEFEESDHLILVRN